MSTHNDWWTLENKFKAMADLDGQLGIDVIINEVDIFAEYLTQEKL
jgi:hypothetical protein